MPKPPPQTMEAWMQEQQRTQARQGLRAGGIGPLRYGVVSTAGASPVVTMSDDSSVVTVGAWPSSYTPVVGDTVLVAPFKGAQGQVAILEVVTLGGATSQHLRPWAEAAGSSSTATGGTAITFPAGRFTVAPIVTVGNGTQATLGIGRAINVTATGFSLYTYGVAAATAIAGTGTTWHAIQMTPTAAAG